MVIILQLLAMSLTFWLVTTNFRRIIPPQDRTDFVLMTFASLLLSAIWVVTIPLLIVGWGLYWLGGKLGYK